MPFSNWYPFTESGFKNAPECKGVYQVYCTKRDIAYIGSSETSIRSRLIDHKKEVRFIKAKWFRYMRVSDNRLWTTAKHIERNLCNKYFKEHDRKPLLQERSPKHVDDLDWLD